MVEVEVTLDLSEALEGRADQISYRGVMAVHDFRDQTMVIIASDKVTIGYAVSDESA